MYNCMNQTASLRAAGEAISQHIKSLRECRVAARLAMTGISLRGVVPTKVICEML